LGERDLYAVRKLFGVMFQDGALFGSMNRYRSGRSPARRSS
jgi:phospholipid/cholesterol/gamma-HCH transport system ATP-binding protein